MTERRGRENKLKIERLRQRAKTAKVPESASPICLGAPPPPGSGILGTLRLRLKLRARGRAGKNRGRERPRGPRGGRRLGDRMPGSCRRLPTPPRTVRWPRALYPAPTGPSAPRPRSPPSVPERPLCGPSPRFPPAPLLPPTGTPPHCSASAPPPSPSPGPLASPHLPGSCGPQGWESGASGP